MLIEASSPSDCMVLEKHHIKCDQISTLQVLFDTEFTTSINGPAKDEAPKIWHDAMQHLLDTYRPALCVISTIRAKTAFREDYTVQLGEDVIYKAFSSDRDDMICFRM